MLWSCPGTNPFWSQKQYTLLCPSTELSLLAMVLPLMHSRRLTQDFKEVWSALSPARNGIALTYRHFLYPSEMLVLSRSIDRFLEPRLHIAVWALGWVFLWIHSDSQVAWELYRARGLGVVITVFSANPKGGFSRRQNHTLIISIQQR